MFSLVSDKKTRRYFYFTNLLKLDKTYLFLEA